ncbi:uncharacterized protein L201_000805 [Kwoniella dendrophila CBS 6074]|uniref:Myb-like domain-containing protein n=1 Tax=Kwoniella dendrophila CBS 6074 TaxID=1295534 RepID=A0AAX4JN31_9TREE
MPRQAADTSSPTSKPYDRPSTPIKAEDNKPNPKSPKKSPSTKTERKRENVAGRKWTSEELLILFNHVMKNGQRDWDNAVQGRTANQCNQTWSKTLLPFIKQSIESKGV